MLQFATSGSFAVGAKIMIMFQFLFCFMFLIYILILLSQLNWVTVCLWFNIYTAM